jgi:penicillin-binding protein 1B
MTPPARRSRLARFLRGLSAFLGITGVGIAAAAIAAWFFYVLPWWRPIRDEAAVTSQAHWDLAVDHPGWSFPARVWSAPAPLDLPIPRRVAEARARGYQEACPPVNPGEICPKTGEALLRGGHFAEGDQPPGNTGWTRDLAFEPVDLGMIVGPTGEIREHLPLEKAPARLIRAILAAEDERFYEHPGVDIEGIARASWVNWTAGAFSQGASTLTMQLTRAMTGRKEKSIERKLDEMGRAAAVDRYLGKDRVLQMYLDAPYLGQQGTFSVCGFRAAARLYYGVDAPDLTLDQAATLAGILPAPARYAPDRHPEAARERRDRVLRRMGELGWDRAEVDAALAAPIEARGHPLLPAIRYPAYFSVAREALLAAVPSEVAYGAGLDVYTALDPVVQEAVEEVLGERVAFLDRLVWGRGVGPLLAAAAFADPTTGRLVAAHDTALLDPAGFNRVTQMRRQPGSSFKPIVYAMAFSPGPDGKPRRTPSTSIADMPHAFNRGGPDVWTPRNSNSWYMPEITLARGLAMSANLAAANLLDELGGPEPLIAFAQGLGFDTSGFPHEMGLSLGQGQVTPQEMVRFVTTVAGDGRRASASPLISAVDAFGRVRYENPVPTEQALTPEAALLTREIMRLVVASGTGWSVKGRHGVEGYRGEVIGKTGTASEEKDLWFIGATPEYAGAVWVGYELPAQVGGHASEVAAPLFGWLLASIHEGLEPRKFDSSGVVRRWVCANTGLAANPTCPNLQIPFLPDEKIRGVCQEQHPVEHLAPPPPAIPTGMGAAPPQ